MAFNANVNTDSAANVTLTADGNPVAITPMVPEDDRTTIIISLSEDFEADATYVLTVPTTVTDALGGGLAAEETITWTTGMGAAPMVDAGTPDAS